MSKWIVIDGNSIASRAFYALPLLSNSAGLHTNAVYGFTTMLLKLIEDEKPTHILVAFDAGKVTFRHEGYEDYKGGRAKTPPELSEQFPLIKELLQAFRIEQFELPGYEADDIIGTLSRLADEQEKELLIVSGDKDMLQLVSETVNVALTRKGISEIERYDPSAIQEKYGLTPDQIIDLKGLMGDASDNIPGIPGVGEKTALKLLHQYGSVEQVLEQADELTGKMKEKVKEHAEDARMSKKLATIFREVPMDIGEDRIRYEGYDSASLKSMFKKLEFKSLLERMEFAPAGGEAADADRPKEALDVFALTDSSEDAGRLIAVLGRVEAVHVEVTGENPHAAEVVGVTLLASPGADGAAAAYFATLAVLQAESYASVREWLAAADNPKTVYDAHKAEVALFWNGIALRGVQLDILLAAYLLNPTEGDHTLSGVAEAYGIEVPAADEDVFGKGAKYRIPEVPVLSEHLGRKALAIYRLTPKLKAELDKGEMGELCYDLELPLSGVLADMEKKGIKVDATGLRAYGEELGSEITRLEERIYELAGTTFNINSTKQLGEILFDKLGLPAFKKTKTGYSTDAEVLEKLAPYHEIVAALLQYRQLAKLQSTYVEGLLKEINPRTGKVHTYYRQTIAATGRLSSQFPNLQNIPIRMEEGKKIRKVFVPSEEGWHILSADYSQIELRVLAHISGDERMKEAFLNGLDIHTKTAMDVFGVSESEVDSNMRRQAKAVNFGIVYGISDYGLSQNLNITRKDAAEFIEQYFAVFDGVKKYMENIVQEARKTGYVSTLLNRRRFLPDITASNFNRRSFAERTAMNTPIQGTAADIIKLAMVQMNERLLAENVRSRMLLQVHDELVFEVPEEELGLMTKLVPEVMGNAMKLDVPLRADVSHGINWYEAK